MNYKIGDQYSESFPINKNVIEKFSEFSQDYNPIHMDIDFAKDHGYSRQVAHGVIQLSYLSKIIGMDFPGSGSMWMNQQVNWLMPVVEGDVITIILTIKHYSHSSKVFTITTKVINQNNEPVMNGEAQIKMTSNVSVISSSLEKSSAPSPVKREDVAMVRKPQQRVALVTGASRGIGAETAVKLANDGYKVVINYKNNKKNADDVVNQIKSQNLDAISICADISKEHEVQDMATTIFAKWGGCDVVVHSASPAMDILKIEDMEYGDITPYFDIYLKGAMHLVKIFSPNMKKYKFGRFVFLGTSSLFGAPPNGLGAYLIAKEALWGYTKALSVALAHDGITVNMVSPSLTVTDLTVNIPVRIKEIEAIKNPARRLATTEDTAFQIAHLCSEKSSYINGVNMPITATPV